MGGGEGDCCPGPGGGGRCSADVRVEDLLASGPSSSAHGHAEDSGGERDGEDEEELGGDEHECCAGALILRGNRCVLTRSLTGEWEGMRIPWLPTSLGRPSREAALDVVTDLCGIDSDEVHLLNVPPAHIVVPDKVPIAVHAFYATSAPPPGPLENADTEDPEDSYDWYTFPRAMEALAADPHARAALATMACALAAGAAGGTVPNQWGGVFGQEWTARAFSMLPGPPLKLEPSGCTIASLLAASADAGGRDTGVEGGVAEEDPEAAMGEPPSKRPRAEPGGAAA